VRLSQKVYRVKESNGFAVIKLLVSGYRRSSIQVGVRAFEPTKFDLPAGLNNCMIQLLRFIMLYTLAAGKSDFKRGTYYFHCPSHANEATIKIPILNDNKEEETESFAVSLFISRYYQDRGVEIVDPFLAEVIIEDGQCYISCTHLSSSVQFYVYLAAIFL